MSKTKWTREALLAEARRRTAGMVQIDPAIVQKMLESLVVEAGWEEKDLLNALCTDVIKRSTRPPPRMSGTMSVVIPGTKVQKKAAAGGGK